MTFEIVAKHLQFPEGPVCLSDGSMIVVEIKRGTLSRVWPHGRKEIVAHLGGGPNGAAIGPDGKVYVTNNGGMTFAKSAEGVTSVVSTPADYQGGCIQRVDLANGTAETVYSECGGIKLRGPNDLVFDGHGGFWFTDMGKRTDRYVDHGAIYYATADGTRIARWRDRLVTPNGIGLSCNGNELYVAETRTGRLWAYRISMPGVLEPVSGPVPARLIVTLPDYQLLDSLAVQADGTICVATLIRGGITIIDPASGRSKFIDVPGEPSVTNICFGGPDMRDAWITGSGRGTLMRTRWPSPGLRLAHNL